MIEVSAENERLREYLLVGVVSPDEADAIRRSAGVGRDAFDDLLLRMTAYPLGEGRWDTVTSYFYGYSQYIASPLWQHPPLIPAEVVRVITSSAAEYAATFSFHPPGGRENRRKERDAMLAGIIRELAGPAGIGGTLYDAGIAVYGHVIASRISDGLVHPAVGANVWSVVTTHGSTGTGPAYKAAEDVAELVRAWEATEDRQERRSIEFAIAHTAQQCTWGSVVR